MSEKTTEQLDHRLEADFKSNSFPDVNPENPPPAPDGVVQSLDVIRQDKSKLVEEEYKPKEWVEPKLQQIKAQGSLNISTFADPSTIKVEDNAVSLKITTQNEQAKAMETKMRLIFFENGIVKLQCINPANPSKFSFEMIEKPESVSPLALANKVETNDEEFAVNMNENTKLVVRYSPFMVKIVSTKDGADDPLFRMNTNKSLMFDDNLSADFTFHTEYLYGMPERAHNLLIEDTKEDLPYRFFNLDIFGYAAYSKNGLYGCIPMMITRKKESPKWASVYWQNASETYIEIHKAENASDTFWVSERGNLEAYIFAHHSAPEHFKAISSVVGKTAMPQYFSLGYHQCRYSYMEQKDVLEVNQKFNEHEIPCDTLTLDIDHTDEMQYFTWNHDAFPDPKKMQEILDKDKRKLITIADPHIKADESYHVFKNAPKDLFVKDSDNKLFLGECWPGESVYLDFLNEESRNYWASCYQYDKYPHSTPNLFAWNDMNEPSVFEEKDKTLPKDALHTVKSLAEPDKAIQVEHREVHNIFGYCMSKATYLGLLNRNKDRNIRPHALSRSFFAGSQKWCAIWTGDSLTSWEHLKVSVPMLLSMSLCGISFVGSDVGGFVGDPEPELLIRWYQLGIFMPYFRGHSDKRCQRREPWLAPPKTFEIIKQTIRERYRLLPYWYTCFEEHCRTGLPLLKPTWLDKEAYMTPNTMRDEERFMVGDSLLVEPILDEGKYIIKDPFQGMQGRWYDYYTKKEVFENQEHAVGLEKIGCYLKGGKAIPLFEVLNHMKSSKDVKDANINLYIGVDEEEMADGKIYFDDGETFDYKKGSFMKKKFEFEKDVLTWQDMGRNGYTVPNKVTKAVIMGLHTQNYTTAFLEIEGAAKQKIQLTKNIGHIVLDFVAPASKIWKIFLRR